MVEYKVVKEKFISSSQAKEILSTQEELEYEQKLAFEHTKSITKSKKVNVEKLVSALRNLENRKLKEELILSMVDIAPKDIEDLKVILAGSPISFRDEEVEEIFKTIRENVK